LKAVRSLWGKTHPKAWDEKNLCYSTSLGHKELVLKGGKPPRTQFEKNQKKAKCRKPGFCAKLFQS